MKKLFALLLTCSMLTCVFTACGKEDTSSENSSSSSSSEVSDESSETSEESSETSEESSSESSELLGNIEEDIEEFEEIEEEDISEAETTPTEAEKVAITSGKADDKNLIGAWTNDELSASYSSIKFSEDGVISAVVDCSTIMTISDDKYLNMSGTDCPYTFDGTNFSCSLTGADMGITDPDVEIQGFSVLEMTKLEPSAESDINGKYLLTGGVLSDAYSQSLPMEGDIYVTVSNSKDILMEVQVCGYDADGKNLTWKGDAKAILGIDSDTEAVTPYTIDGDTLTLSGSTEEILTRNKDIN